MNKLFSAFIMATLFFFTNVALAEEHHSEKKSFKVTELKPGFQFLQGKGGNILLSEGKDGLLIVDSDYSEMTPALLETLAKYKSELKYVLNTHWHGDHTQGNKELGKSAEIIAHDNVYQRLNSHQEVKLFNMVSKPYPADALPDITFDHSLTLRFNDETIKALHLPNGHTDGDSIIFFEKANIVHMGDHLFNGMFPFVDVGTNGSVRGMVTNIDGILDHIADDTIVVPGHGAISNKEELLAFRDMLVGTSNEVEMMMQQNMSLEAMQEKGLSEQWKVWGNGFLNEKVWIGIIHSSLTASLQTQDTAK
ncbi:MBL fold metallo-hydrolase [Moritella sp. Urea-trap-13]|uniref:MBL fold metallo-hydrolase n=1 Tax=Moritella sp. Urea-trap-13 TaxID=2058327 RepID=UPI000C32903E|nr:MBL fold metallo-hydrolase [Moritella sp. Urea-trap-13]PKH06610.1 MBL fold metallo-hydrolase [Moritella sp. Urea-trap-13]